MYPPIYTTCNNAPGVQSVLGGSPVRLYPFGEAPTKVEKPYAVYTVLTGVPENSLSCVPGIDRWTLTVDVYGVTESSAWLVAEEIRDAVEPVAYVTSWGPQGRDPDTRLFRVNMVLDWYANRNEDSVGPT